MTTVTNSADGGSQGTTVNQANSGGSSGTAWANVSIGSGAACIYDGAHPHRTYGIKYTTGASPAACYTEWTTALGLAATKYFRFYLYITGTPGTDTPYLMLYSGGSYAGSVMVTTLGKLCFQTAGFAQVATTTATVSTGTLVRIEGKIVGASGTGGSIELKLFNTTDSTTATETTSATSLNTVGVTDAARFGTPSGDKSNFTAWMAGHGFSDAAYLGPEAVGAVYAETGGAAAPAAGGGAGTVAVHATYARRGGGTARGGGYGTEQVPVYVKAGGAVALGSGDGWPGGTRTVAGGAVTVTAADGARQGTRRVAGGGAAVTGGAGLRGGVRKLAGGAAAVTGGGGMRPARRTVRNSAAGGSQGTTVTAENSGGPSGDPWDAAGIGAGCTLTFDNTHTHLSPYAYKFTTPATPDTVYLAWTASSGPAQEKWFRFYLWLPSLPSADTAYIRFQSGGAFAGTMQISTAGHIRYQDANYAYVTTGTAVAATGKWIRLEGRILGDPYAGSIEFRLYNTADSTVADDTITASGLNTFGPVDNWHFGCPFPDKAYFLIWMAGLGVSDAGWLGPAGSGGGSSARAAGGGTVTVTAAPSPVKAGGASATGAAGGTRAGEMPRGGGAATVTAGGATVRLTGLVKAGGATARLAGGGGHAGTRPFAGGSAAAGTGGGRYAGPRLFAGGGAARPVAGGTRAGGRVSYAKTGGGTVRALGGGTGYSTGWVRTVMADSLVIGDIELLGGGIVNTNPACAGAVFRLLPGYDPGAPQPTTDAIASLLLDGERPFGHRASNRVIKLPVWIIATDRDNLAAAREHLEALVDRDLWVLTWARDRGGKGPLPLLLDCFRGEPTVVTSDLQWEKRSCMKMEVTIPAMPYGRSDVQERIRFASPVPQGPPPPPSPVLIDNYETITSPQCYQHSACVVGPHSCCWDPDDDRCGDPGGLTTRFDYNSVLANSVDLTGMTSIAMYLGLGSRYYHCLPFHGRTTACDVELSLWDTAGNTISMSRSGLRLPASPNYQAPCFTRVSMRLPTSDPFFNYPSLAGYQLKVSNHHWCDEHHLRWVTLYVDELKAYPDSQTVVPVTKGAVYTLFGLKGTARTPMSAQFQQPPTAGSPTTLTTTGVGNYTVPAGTSWLKVECIGAGGAGAGRNSAGMGGGGGGGEYAREDVFAASDGQVIPYAVGAAGTDGASPVDGAASYFGPGPSSSTVVRANGGKSAGYNTTGGGLGGTGSANSVHHDGGTGRNATGSVGGGGGSSGGTALPGNTPAGTGPSSWTSPGTTSWTCPAGVTQVYAECWGSGGGGATGDATRNGAAGGGGEYAAGYINVTPGNSYSVVVAAGGAKGSGAGVAGGDGASSTFTGDAGRQVVAHGGTHGSPGTSGGSGLGGSGSSNSVHYNGGLGGWANPYSGGGGSSASPSGPGNNGDGYGNPGNAPTDGGKGGAGSGASGNNGGDGAVPGGGGGGTWSSTTAGAGGAGKVRLSFPGQQGGQGAPDQYGGVAVAGGGAGGNGGAAGNTGGSAGSAPGGGGGGGDSAGGTVTGGAGGAGKIVVTPYASQPWKALIVHRPPRGTPKTFQPCVSVGAGADTPNGGTWYTLPQPVTGVNARLSGTYSAYLIASSWNGTGTRTVTVTVRQVEYSGGQSYSTATPGVTFTPSQVTNGILQCGTITLPVRDLPPDNTAAYFQVSVTDTNTSDRFYDLILLDSMGQTVVVNEPSTGYLRYWVDAPDANTPLGRIMGSQGDRVQAVSVLANTDALSGGPLTVEPADGENLLFAHCPDGLAPAIGVTYSPGWYWDRTI